MLRSKLFYIIPVIFLSGIAIRFLYFPNNVYFAYDQARDAYSALEILKGDWKLVGPPSFASDKLFPGPLIFYVYAPIYFLFGPNPETVSAFLRIYNALGIFLVFFIGTILFNKRIGFLSALLFALSYEQTQYSLFISHQPLAVITVLLFYLGLCLYLFKKEPRGLILTALGWGLSMQFHYGYILLGIPLTVILLIFRKNIIFPKPRIFILAFGILFFTLSTFIISELKYHFFSSFLFHAQTSHFSIYGKETIFIINRFFHDIFISNYEITPYLVISLTIIWTVVVIFKNSLRKKLIFLAVWFLGGLMPYLISGVPSYYYSAATSVSVLLLSALLIQKIWSKNILLGMILFSLIVANNINQITTINKEGVNSDIAIQPGMLTIDQKRALDYIYTSASGNPFSINSLTIPLDVNTTWSFIFEWYGKEKYGIVPVFGGNTAKGYKGNLETITARSDLPSLQFLIIEPTLGIRESYRDKFFREESYFTKILEEKQFGQIIVQKRRKF